MQVETIQNVPKVDKKQYLRVAAISNKSALCFLYVGQNEKIIDFLSDSFESGLTASGIDEACQVLKTQAIEVDVIILDSVYDEKELNKFHSFLTNRELQCIPVLYNYQQLTSGASSKQHILIDDVIDLSNWQFDFSKKVSFLKKIKEQNCNQNQKQMIEPSRSIIKRLFDILLASILLIVLSPFFLIVALAIRLESRGPIFYNSKRAGRGFTDIQFL